MTRSQETGFGLQEKEAKMNDILATCYSEKEKNDVLNTQGRAIEEEKLRLQDEQEKLMAIAGEVKRAVMYRFSTLISDNLDDIYLFSIQHDMLSYSWFNFVSVTIENSVYFYVIVVEISYSYSVFFPATSEPD